MRSISEICSRRCELVHIDPSRVVPPSSGALQRGREKCVHPFFLVLATSATIFATGATPVAARDRVTPVAASDAIGIACEGDDCAGAGECGNSPATRNVRLLHRAARPPARLILISRRPILISRTPLSRQFLQGRVADAECVMSKIRWLWSAVYLRKARNRSGDHSGQVWYWAPLRHADRPCGCPFPEVDRNSSADQHTDANDPSRKSALVQQRPDMV